MIWALLLLAVGGLVWFLLQPRRLQTLENIPEVVDEHFRAHGLVETTEDPREVRPIAEAAQAKVSDIPVKGQGDSLTFDWPNDRTESHGAYQTHQDGPLHPQ
ncbi:MAG TPA: hypothetical protein VK464_02110 [Symbiobacteriaceae bacterium]|jgi:hypothetical protein|nr:hypothetical protein [Symbiobacteriaceae bacterium]